MRRWLWIVLLLLALYLAWRWMGRGGQAYGPIKIFYDKASSAGYRVMGVAKDAVGKPFQTYNVAN